MKKLLLFLSILVTAYTSFAQSTKPGDSPIITFGVKGGINFSKQSFSSASTSSLTGFQFGGVVDIGFTNFSIQPGVLYTTKGGSEKDGAQVIVLGEPNDTISAKNTRTVVSYIEVPINFIYKIPVSGGTVFLGAGPYIAFGISGNYKYDEFESRNESTTHQSLPVHFGSTLNDDLKNPDYGVDFMAGFKLNKGIAITAGYDLGLANLTPVGTGKTKNNTIDFTISYFFK